MLAGEEADGSVAEKTAAVDQLHQVVMLARSCASSGGATVTQAAPASRSASSIDAPLLVRSPAPRRSNAIMTQPRGSPLDGASGGHPRPPMRSSSR